MLGSGCRVEDFCRPCSVLPFSVARKQKETMIDEACEGKGKGEKQMRLGRNFLGSVADLTS